MLDAGAITAMGGVGDGGQSNRSGHVCRSGATEREPLANEESSSEEDEATNCGRAIF